MPKYFDILFSIINFVALSIRLYVFLLLPYRCIVQEPRLKHTGFYLFSSLPVIFITGFLPFFFIYTFIHAERCE